ncbi:hypothetical protein MHK_003597 [Candidatus Magnetomorum sp. HK-1]|nr:hypothetical protein MHK_003597 [Candidatus Magnetomorum sp. HK-1]
MITIRSQQIDDLKQIKLQDFIKKAKRFLKKNYPVKTGNVDEKKLTTIIETSIKRAEAYNIVTEQGIISFLEFMFSLSFDFDSNQKTNWTGDILKDHLLSESEKIMKIINSLKRI